MKNSTKDNKLCQQGVRLQAALDLMELGIAMMRQNIRRRHADASEAAVDRELQDWLIDNGLSNSTGKSV